MPIVILKIERRQQSFRFLLVITLLRIVFIFILKTLRAFLNIHDSEKNEEKKKQNNNKF